MAIWEWFINNSDDVCRKCKGKVKERHSICVHCGTWFPCTEANKLNAFAIFIIFLVLAMTRL